MHSFKNYQSLSDAQATPGNARRPIQRRIEQYGLKSILTNQSDVLDIGCNRGYFGILLSPIIKSYTGLDHDKNEQAIGLAEAKTRKITNVNLVNSTFEKYQGAKKFDLILCLAVHGYITLPMNVVADRLFNHLKRGGHLVLESHPPGYLGEPTAKWDPLTAELKKTMSLVREDVVIDRGLRRELQVYKRP